MMICTTLARVSRKDEMVPLVTRSYSEIEARLSKVGRWVVGLQRCSLPSQLAERPAWRSQKSKVKRQFRSGNNKFPRREAGCSRMEGWRMEMILLENSSSIFPSVIRKSTYFIII